MEISDETYRLIKLARTADVEELLNLKGDLNFPRTTLDEQYWLEEDIRKIPPERLLVILAFEARLCGIHFPEEHEYRAAQRKLDEEILQELAQRKK